MTRAATPRDLQLGFELCPVAMALVDDDGAILGRNAAFGELTDSAFATLHDADAAWRELLAWPSRPRPPAASGERSGWVADARGQPRHVGVRLRAFEVAPGLRRFLVVVEDRSAEHERDLARREIGAMMETAGVGIATYDSQHGWLGGGEGSTTPGMLQSVTRDMVEPASREAYESLQRALRLGQRAEVRYAVRHPQAGLRWLLTRVEPGLLAPKRHTASVVTLDVTEQELARGRQEQLLLERAAQAERTRALLDSVLVGIVTVGDGGIEWMNRSARRMFGGELADFVGEPVATVATDEADHPLRRTHYLETLGDGQAEQFECRLQARDGRRFWVVGNVVATRREAAAGRQLTFALLDIERRRQAELSIAQAQDRLQRIIETAPLAIGLFDGATLRPLQLNHLVADFLGPGVDVRALPAELGEPMRAVLAAGEPSRQEMRRGSDGARRTWDLRLVPLADATGRSGAQLLLVASDVSELRAAEQARFEAAIAQREMLVKEVHHRIKNNLQGVAGLMQQIARRKPEVAQVLGEAVGQVQAIAQVYGLQVGAVGPLRVKGVVEAIAASVGRLFGRPITTEVNGEAPHRWALPEVESIPIALSINELLTNALKHGSVDEPPRCTLDCRADAVRIVIANHGRLPEGFDLARVPGGVSGLGLVRSLLPRRTATLTLEARGSEVVATVALVPPGVTLLEPL